MTEPLPLPAVLQALKDAYESANGTRVSVIVVGYAVYRTDPREVRHWCHELNVDLCIVGAPWYARVWHKLQRRLDAVDRGAERLRG